MGVWQDFLASEWHGLPARGIRHGQDACATVASVCQRILPHTLMEQHFPTFQQVYDERFWAGSEGRAMQSWGWCAGVIGPDLFKGKANYWPFGPKAQPIIQRRAQPWINHRSREFRAEGPTGHRIEGPG